MFISQSQCDAMQQFEIIGDAILGSMICDQMLAFMTNWGWAEFIVSTVPQAVWRLTISPHLFLFQVTYEVLNSNLWLSIMCIEAGIARGFFTAPVDENKDVADLLEALWGAICQLPNGRKLLAAWLAVVVPQLLAVCHAALDR